jgi:FkbM family methyltransferase
MYNVDKINKELKSYKDSRYYGQWETDKIIESYFDIGKPGNCIEVGAADGIKGSNTKYFEDNGWNVLCIEANPHQEKSLRDCRKLVKMYACGQENYETKLTIFNVGQSNIQSSITSLSPDSRLIGDHKHIINETCEVTVQVKTLDWILTNEVSNTPFENLNYIDFVSIDTEGTELDVLKGINFEKYKIKLLVVENNYSDDNIRSHLKNFGYKLDQRYKINDFYIKGNL